MSSNRSGHLMKIKTLEPVFGPEIDRHPFLWQYAQGENFLVWCPYYESVELITPFNREWLTGNGCRFLDEFPYGHYAKLPVNTAHQHICLSCPAERKYRDDCVHAQNKISHKTLMITQRDTLRLFFDLDGAWDRQYEKVKVEYEHQ